MIKDTTLAEWELKKTVYYGKSNKSNVITRVVENQRSLKHLVSGENNSNFRLLKNHRTKKNKTGRKFQILKTTKNARFLKNKGWPIFSSFNFQKLDNIQCFTASTTLKTKSSV